MDIRVIPSLREALKNRMFEVAMILAKEYVKERDK